MQEESSSLEEKSAAEHKRYKLTSEVDQQPIPRTEKSGTTKSKIRFQSQGFSAVVLLKAKPPLQEHPSKDTILSRSTLSLGPIVYLVSSHAITPPERQKTTNEALNFIY